MSKTLPTLGRSAAAVTAVAAVAMSGAAGSASAASAPPSKGVAITAPSVTHIFTGRSVPVAVRAGAGVTGIEAFVGNTNVSNRFSRHGETWRAELPAHLIGQGAHRLLVQSLTTHGRGGTAAETFTVGHTARGLLTGVHTRNIDNRAVTITARSRTATKANLTVNGKPVADISNPGYDATHSWQLTKLDGLRTGVNHVTVSVQERNGAVATKTWSFTHKLGSGRLGADDAPALGAQGLFLGTDLESVDGGHNYNTIYIAGKPYTSTVSNGTMIMVQLDAATLAPVDSSVDGTEITPKDGTITVAVWQDHDVSFAGQATGSRIWIGTREVADNESMTDCAVGNCTTNLHGWLEPASGVNPATWTDSDMVDVETRSAGDSDTTNTMKVGGKSYPVTLPSGATGGFELLTLNNQGQPVSDPSVYGFGPSLNQSYAENELTTALTNAINDGHVTVMLQGFGVLPHLDPTGALAKAMTTLGANADVFSRFGNSALPPTNYTYALISGRFTTQSGDVKYLAQEASSERSGQGQLQSQLVRDQTQNDYVPETTTSADPSQFNDNARLMQLVYQAPSSWNDWVPDGSGGLRAPTTAEQAAFNDIQAEMVSNNWVSTTNELCPSAPDPVRAALCNADETKLSSIAGEVETQLSYDANKGAAGGYTAADFKTVQNAIADEFNNAATIRGAINEYRTIFGTASVNGIVNAGTIGHNILKNLPTVNAGRDYDPLAALSALTSMASLLPEVGPAMTFMSGAFSLMGVFQSDTGTGDQIANNVQVTQATAAANLQSQFQNASDELSVFGDYMASDPVKLMQGAALLGGDYALSGKTETDMEYASENAANQYLWGTLMAPAYTVWTGPASLGNPPQCENSEWPGAKVSSPFSNSDDNAFWPGVGTVSWIGLITNPTNFGSYAKFGLPAATADQLAGQVNPKVAPTSTSNVGAVEPYFENTYLTKTNIPIWNKTSQYGCHLN